jgi:FkbM family methyltransferase
MKKAENIKNTLLKKNPLWIVDIGASGGISERWENFTSKYKAVLFEPDPREYERLRADNDCLIVLNSALSDSINSIDFLLCKKQQVSSTYLPNMDLLKKFPFSERFEVLKRVQIKTDTLDNQLKINNIADIDFIKIDTQGHELKILKGSTRTLENAIGLELEVEFSLMYVNQPLFGDIDSFVRSKGFYLFDIKRHYWQRKGGEDYGNQKGQLVFGDALYLKYPEHLLQMKNVSQEKIIRSFCVYLVFGYPDLAQVLLSESIIEKLISQQTQKKMKIVLRLYKSRSFIPNFKGKGIVQCLFQKVSDSLSDKGLFSGSDRKLGNE